jgi:hypothetical protein
MLYNLLQKLWLICVIHRELEGLDSEQARLLEEQARANGSDVSLLSSDSEGEHDLDDDIPDADGGEQEWLDDDDALPTEEGEGDYADTHGVGLSDGPMGGRDLDDDIPEAGSYQHTDTDLEDSESEMDMGGRGSLGGMVRGNARMSAFGSLFGESSSPVVPPSSGRGGRRSGGLGRAMGREN